MAEINTSRLTLRPYTADDLDDLANLYADGDVTAHTKLGQLTGTQAGMTLQDYLSTWQKLDIGVYAVFLRTSGDYVGEAGFFELENRDYLALRYAFHKHAWGQGFAYEAAAAVTDHAFRHVELSHINAFAEGPNEASHHIIKKLGFVLEGSMQIPKCTLYRYGLSAEQWAASREVNRSDAEPNRVDHK